MQLRCDLWLTRAPPHDEMFRIIAQCGLAAHDWTADGRLTVIWERPGRAVSAAVTPGNIVAGSVRAEYPSSQTADEIAVRFVDPDADWDWSTLRRLAPGVTGFPDSTATLTLEGVATRRQAAIEANLQAARQVHHRRKIRWRMPEEGFEVARGQVVAMTHSLLDGGVSGRLAAGSTAARVILDRDLALDDAADSRMLFRPLQGAPHTTAVQAGAADREIVLTDPLPFAPDHDGAQPFDVLWRYYEAATPPAELLVTGTAPVSRGEVELEAIDEVDAYYAAATADLSEPIAAAVLRPPRVLRIETGEALVRVGAGFAVEISATLIVEGDWRGGTVTASLDGGDARVVARLLEGETQARWLEDPEGRLTVTATPGSAAAPFGESATAVHDIVGVTAPPALPTNFLIDVLGDGTRRFRWVAARGPRSRRHRDPLRPGRPRQRHPVGRHDAPAPGPPHGVALGVGRARHWGVAVRRAIDRHRRAPVHERRPRAADAGRPAPRRGADLALPRRRGVARRDHRRGALRRRPGRARIDRQLHVGGPHDLGRLDELGAR